MYVHGHAPTKLTNGSDIRLSWALLSLLGGGGKGFRMSGYP
jgi:hypothetical protein